MGQVETNQTKMVIEHDLEAELSGKVEDGNIKLDTADMDALGARIREVRIKSRYLKKEDERLRELILAHPLAKLGYGNESIEIGKNDSVDMTAELVLSLIKAKKLNEALNVSISVPKVRKLAEKNDEIAQAYENAKFTGRKVCTR